MLSTFVKNHQRAGLIISLPVVLFVLDRMAKWYFAGAGINVSLPVIGDYFYLAFVANPGIAFGIALADWIIIALTVVIMAYLVHLLLEAMRNQDWLAILSILLILAGASSNLLDRIFYGAVIDYLVISNLTVFNLADAMISVGVIGMALEYTFKSSTPLKITKLQN